MNEEYISISEFAKRAGVSRQAVYARLDKDLSSFLVIDNGKKSLNSRALSLFTVKENDKEVYSLELVASLRKNNDVLTSELDFKNKEIEQLREENRKLSEQLLSLSDKVGNTLQAISQTQLADKMIEGQKMIEEKSTAAVEVSPAADIKADPAVPKSGTKKKPWQFWKKA